MAIVIPQILEEPLENVLGVLGFGPKRLDISMGHFGGVSCFDGRRVRRVLASEI